MAYQSLYRRYRPQRFSEVRGQEHVVTALRNAVREERVGHAYLFSGPRGTGKTTTARILAKALNCPNLHEGEPCGECESCLAIQNGTSFDVHELDAASNNKVEEIRDLISKAALGTPGRTKVYILDEVHMLTAAASNALLKTLEEPPEHVVFVLATTDPQKVLATIRSRTQHYDVHLLSADELTDLAEFIIKDADLEVPDGTVAYVVHAGAGSARDMESALDQVAAAGTLPDGGELLNELIDALADRNTGGALLAVDRAIQNGRAPRALGEELIGRLRDVFLSSMKADLGRLPDHEQRRVAEQAQKLGPRGATRALEALGQAFVGIQDAPDPRITLEIALVRITRPEADTSAAALLERIERLEQGTPASPASPATASPATGAAIETPAAGVDAPLAVDAPPAVDPTPTRPPPDESPTAPPARANGGRADDGDSAGGTSASTRPADLARQSLSQTRGQRGPAAPRATPKPKAKTKAPAPAAATKAAPSKPASRPSERAAGQATTDPATTPESTTPESTTPESTTPESTTPDLDPTPGPPAGDLPSRDELTLAWGDVILPSLKGKAKARFGSGRWVGVDSAARFALPNATHRDRCEDCRADVEAALAAHFGVPVPVRLVLDDEDGPGSPARAADPSTGGARPATPEDEDEIDTSELIDAPDAGASSLERITDVFPGAELVEEE